MERRLTLDNRTGSTTVKNVRKFIGKHRREPVKGLRHDQKRDVTS